MCIKQSLYIEKEEGYYGNIRDDIISLVQKGPNKILEIGCGRGCTLKKLKELGKASKVCGVEIDKDSAQYAKAYLDYMVKGDIEEMSSLPFDRSYFDYIIFADVLEHLINPWKVLKMVNNYLSDEGSIIATTPNLRHKSIILPLILKGRFQYNIAGGNMDVTHLRFFTRDSLTSLFKTSGYTRVYFIDYPLSLKLRIATALSVGFLRDFFIYEFRVIAKNRCR